MVLSDLIRALGVPSRCNDDFAGGTMRSPTNGEEYDASPSGVVCVGRTFAGELATGRKAAAVIAPAKVQTRDLLDDLYLCAEVVGHDLAVCLVIFEFVVAERFFPGIECYGDVVGLLLAYYLEQYVGEAEHCVRWAAVGCSQRRQRVERAVAVRVSIDEIEGSGHYSAQVAAAGQVRLGEQVILDSPLQGRVISCRTAGSRRVAHGFQPHSLCDRGSPRAAIEIPCLLSRT